MFLRFLGLGLVVVGSAERLAEIGEDVCDASSIVSILWVAVLHKRDELGVSFVCERSGKATRERP